MSNWNGIGTLDQVIPANEMEGLAPQRIAPFIDHTLLKADATDKEFETLCKEADENGFMSVCVNPHWISKCKNLLKDSSVRVCTVIGFPLGANHSSIKKAETSQAIADGADEVDMVINIGAALSGQMDIVKADISAVVQEAKKNNILSKVILETAYLSNEQIVEICKICLEAGADFVKTSTGFAKGGATVEHISLMRQTVGKNAGVKASGGVRDYAGALAMLKAGATRIGASASLRIIGKKQDVSAGY